jgi:hypothetical protein
VLSPLTIGLVLVVGLSLGLLGGGGSVLLIPILVYIEGLSPHDAVLVSLAVVGIGSGFGAWLHYRNGYHHWRAAFLFSVSGSAGAVVGSQFARAVDEQVLMLLFGVLMLGVGVTMARPRAPRQAHGRCRVVPCLVVGAGVGVLTGFLGVGGGFLLVPAIMLVAGLDTRRAIAASLSTIAVNSMAGLGGHLLSGPALPVQSASALVTVAVGMAGGTFAGGRVRAALLDRIFAGLVLVAGVSVVAMSLYRIAG